MIRPSDAHGTHTAERVPTTIGTRPSVAAAWIRYRSSGATSPPVTATGRPRSSSRERAYRVASSPVGVTTMTLRPDATVAATASDRQQRMRGRRAVTTARGDSPDESLLSSASPAEYAPHPADADGASRRGHGRGACSNTRVSPRACRGGIARERTCDVVARKRPAMRRAVS